MKGESMSYSLFIASRYLTSRSKRTFISIISFMSVLGVAIGVAALVIVMSVYNGVTEEMREKILGANPHVMVMATQAGAFGPEAARGEGEVIERIRETPGVVSATPFLYAEVLLSTPQGATGLVVRGIDPVSAGASSGERQRRGSRARVRPRGHDRGSRSGAALQSARGQQGEPHVSGRAAHHGGLCAQAALVPGGGRVQVRHVGFRQPPRLCFPGRISWAIPMGTSPAWKPS